MSLFTHVKNPMFTVVEPVLARVNQAIKEVKADYYNNQIIIAF